MTMMYILANILVSLGAEALIVVYMHNYVNRKNEWWEDHGRALAAAAILPYMNVAVCGLLVMRLIVAAKGYKNPDYN